MGHTDPKVTLQYYVEVGATQLRKAINQTPALDIGEPAGYRSRRLGTNVAQDLETDSPSSEATDPTPFPPKDLQLEPEAGLEPATTALRKQSSTTELRWQTNHSTGRIAARTSSARAAGSSGARPTALAQARRTSSEEPAWSDSLF